MIQETRTDKIEAAAELIQRSQYIVALTGAGISTESGIPDFRSPESGLWKNADPMTVASIFGFKRNPQAFYDWVAPLTHTMLEARPNTAHLALTKMEQYGILKAVITQNIDSLHTMAGSQTVYELHGHMREATCIHCYTSYDNGPFIKQFLTDGRTPRCPECDGVIKPNVILFGEQLPYRQFLGAQEVTRRSDLMIVIGSSLETAPASDLPLLAQRTGAKLIIINLSPTPADKLADVVIHDRAALTMPAIVRHLEQIA